MPDLEQITNNNIRTEIKEKPINRNVSLKYVAPVAILLGVGAAYCSRKFMSDSYLEIAVFAGFFSMMGGVLGVCLHRLFDYIKN